MWLMDDVVIHKIISMISHNLKVPLIFFCIQMHFDDKKTVIWI